MVSNSLFQTVETRQGDSSFHGSVILIAWVGHCTSHARQKMHWGSFTGSDFFSDVGCPGDSAQSKTLTGQTDIQMPSPLQTSWSTATWVPWTPSFSGGFTSPLTLCPACSPVAGFFMKSGSIGKSHFHLLFFCRIHNKLDIYLLPTRSKSISNS